MSEIAGFQGEYRWLSNFWYSPITVTGFNYQNVEAAYQAGKTLDLNLRNQFEHLTGGEAKKRGKTIHLRADWDLVKIEIMELALRAKFMTHKDLRQKLIDTGDAQIIELNQWGDTYWGMVNQSPQQRVGNNILGKLLMNIREDLIKGS